MNIMEVLNSFFLHKFTLIPDTIVRTKTFWILNILEILSNMLMIIQFTKTIFTTLKHYVYI